MRVQRRKITALIIVFVWIISLVFLQGCATDKPFVKKDLTTIAPLKVIRYETPTLREVTLGRVLVGAILFGGLGAGVASSMVEAKQPIDIGELVMRKFVDRTPQEIPNWPAMNVEEQPSREEYSTSGTLLEFRVTLFDLNDVNGLTSNIITTMKDSEGNVLWKKGFLYYSRKFERKRSIDEFQAENGKLLKEEMEFAADKTVSDFIEHFKKGGRE